MILRRQWLVWLLMLGIGSVMIRSSNAAVSPQVAPSNGITKQAAFVMPNSPKEAASGDAKESAETVNVDETQRTRARNNIPDLLIFLVFTITLSVVLGLRAKDIEKMRDEGFFEADHSSLKEK